MRSFINWLGSLSAYEQFLFLFAVIVIVGALVGLVLAIRKNRRDGQSNGWDDWGSF